MAVCVVAARAVMVPVAVPVESKADAWGRKPFFLAGFAVLAARGTLHTLSDDPFWLVAVQPLDGVGVGVFGALFPVIVADLTRGTGRFNVGQGAISTAHGLGASLSTAVAGVVVVRAGYSAAFLCSSGVAAAGGGLGAVLVRHARDRATPNRGVGRRSNARRRSSGGRLARRAGSRSAVSTRSVGGGPGRSAGVTPRP